MKPETSLPRDFAPYVDEAHKLRAEYIAGLVHDGFAALAGLKQKAAKPAALRSQSGDFCSQG
jgi:hypothetical protein